MHGDERLAVVIDDHPLVAKGMAEYLSNHCGFTQTETANSVENMLNAIPSQNTPHLVLMDFWLSDGISLAWIDAIKSRWVGIRILVVSGEEDGIAARKARSAGAHGFVHKQAPPEIFSSAVATVMSQGKWFAPGVEALDISKRRDMPLTASELGLTPKQSTIADLMLRGHPNRRIAEDLGISEYTVKEHVAAIFSRLGIGSRMELIMLMRGRQVES